MIQTESNDFIFAGSKELRESFKSDEKMGKLICKMP